MILIGKFTRSTWVYSATPPYVEKFRSDPVTFYLIGQFAYFMKSITMS